MNFTKLTVIFVTFALTIGCSSDEKSGPGYIMPQDYDANSSARPEAYGADAMMIRRPMLSSDPNWQPQPFFFKDCTEVGEQFYFSKTSYDCTYP